MKQIQYFSSSFYLQHVSNVAIHNLLSLQKPCLKTTLFSNKNNKTSEMKRGNIF